MEHSDLTYAAARPASPLPPIRQVSHTATRTCNMPAIRGFYENFLGLPMTVTLVADYDAVTKDKSNYIHCFFHLDDGSAIAFFQFEKGYREDAFPRTSDPYERHLALRVDTIDDVETYKVRAESMGLPCFTVDHDDFFSLYLHDPDGEQVEITWHKPSYDTMINPEAADRVLTEWLAATGG